MNLSSFALILSAATAAPDLFFNLGNFVHNLKYMGIVMLVIFVVIGIIIFAINIINYLFSK